ncbi:MAG TPA: hypothetical protein PK951_00910 [Chitinophagaceae bacterium]|nr:hypothetical protein [Chitinophagaceae bacterium]HUM65416.1 hypothetical protein [Chitinophagaceae bacterium]
MKAKSSIIGFTAMLVVTAWTAPAPVPVVKASYISDDMQSRPIFTYFKLDSRNKGVTATWGINEQSRIVGFKIQKTYDNPKDEYADWDDIATMSNSGARSFRYTDDKDITGNIHYRIVALKDNNNSISSAIASVRIAKR